jgi:hypothetical protein
MPSTPLIPSGGAGAVFAGPHELVAGAPAIATRFRQALVAELAASTSIAAIVGANIFPLVVPESKLAPALLYQVQELNRPHDLDGAAGFAEAIVKLGCGSPLFTESEALAEAVRNLVDGLGTTLSGIWVPEIEHWGELDLYDPPIDASDRGTYWIALRYFFRFAEPSPTR